MFYTTSCYTLNNSFYIHTRNTSSICPIDLSHVDLSTDLLACLPCLDFTHFVGQYCIVTCFHVCSMGPEYMYLAVVIYPITVHVSCRGYLYGCIVCLLLFSYSDTLWDGSDIVVLNDVKICSLYTNCQGNNKELQKCLQAMVSNYF